MIGASVGTLERSCVCFVDAGLELLWYQGEVYLVVNLTIRGMPGCYFGSGECWHESELVALYKL